MAFGLPAGELCKSDNIHAWWDSSRLEVIERFKLQCNELTLKILSCFAVCMRLPRDFLAESHQQVLPGNTLKLIKYPKLATQPVSEIPRLSEHTDWGSLTLLFTESPGLELRDPSNQWHDVPLVPGGVVVNIGDALSLWTNKELKSTMHRISWKNLPIDRDRYSIPYFVHPNFGNECLYPSIKANINIMIVATNLQPLTAPVKTEQRILYKDYYNVRLKLTWGSLTKADGEEIFNNSEKDVIKYLQALGVANAGALESNSLPETQTQEVSLVH